MVGELVSNVCKWSLQKVSCGLPQRLWLASCSSYGWSIVSLSATDADLFSFSCCVIRRLTLNSKKLWIILGLPLAAPFCRYPCAQAACFHCAVTGTTNMPIVLSAVVLSSLCFPLTQVRWGDFSDLNKINWTQMFHSLYESYLISS